MPSVNFDKTTLVRDRTQADVDWIMALRQKVLDVGMSGLTTAELAYLQDANARSKGCLNFPDLNRWATAMNAIATVVNTYGYSLLTNLRNNWSLGNAYTTYYSNQIITQLASMYTAVNEIFQEQTSYNIVWGAGYNATISTLPFTNSIMAQPSWADMAVTPINISTLDYSTYRDWNNIEQFLYDVIVFLEELP